MFLKMYKVYGRTGHRQRESFSPSWACNWSDEKVGSRYVGCMNSDQTGTNDYSIVVIGRETQTDCDDEFDGQLSDGIFENSRTGKIECSIDGVNWIEYLDKWQLQDIYNRAIRKLDQIIEVGEQ